MVKTFKELQEVDILVGALYEKNPGLKDSKFGYSYKRFVEKNYVTHLREFQHEINDVRIDNAMEDPKTKEVLRDPTDNRGFKYTKEGLKKVIEQENEIIARWDVKEIEVEPYNCPVESLPTLTEGQVELLIGVLIAEAQ